MNKKTYAILLSFLHICIMVNVEVHSQNEITPPEEILFKNNLRPEWFNFPIDSFFYPTSDELSTPYNSRVIRSIKSAGGYIYILEVTQDIRPGIDPDGFILRKLEKKTGKQIWAHHNTLYSGNTEHESFHPESILSMENDEIIIQGLRQVPYFDNDFPYWYLGALNATPVVYTIHKKTGELISKQVSDNTSNVGFKLNYTYGFQSLVKHGEAYHYLYSGRHNKAEGLRVLALDNNLEFVDTSVYDKIEIEGPEIEFENQVMPSWMNRLGNNRFAVNYIYVKDWGNIFGDDHLIQLAIIDLSDPETPEVLRRINLNEYFINDYHLNRFRRDEVNGHYLIQKESYDGVLDQRWLLWLNEDGDKMAYLPKISTPDRYYYRGFLPVYADAERVIGYAPRGNFHTIDILSFEVGDSVFTELYTLELEDDTYSLVPFVGKIVDDQLILAGWLNTFDGPLSGEFELARFGCNLALDLDKIGIDLSVSTNNILKEKPPPTIYPNPSDGLYFIKGFETFDFEYCTITDVKGSVVSKILRKDIQGSRIDLRDVSKGSYVINYYDKNRRKVYNSSSIVKL